MNDPKSPVPIHLVDFSPFQDCARYFEQDVDTSALVALPVFIKADAIDSKAFLTAFELWPITNTISQLLSYRRLAGICAIKPAKVLVYVRTDEPLLEFKPRQFCLHSFSSINEEMDLYNPKYVCNEGYFTNRQHIHLNI